VGIGLVRPLPDPVARVGDELVELVGLKQLLAVIAEIFAGFGIELAMRRTPAPLDQPDRSDQYTRHQQKIDKCHGLLLQYRAIQDTQA
jgi:hypothetical protein